MLVWIRWRIFQGQRVCLSLCRVVSVKDKVEEVLKDRERFGGVLEDVTKKMLNARNMGERPIIFWAEYLLKEILGFKDEQIMVENVIRAVAYLLLMGGGGE